MIEEWYLPQGAVIETQSAQSLRCHLELANGYGTMQMYTVMPGVVLSYNDFPAGQSVENEFSRPGFVEINHCRQGRYECSMSDGRVVYLGVEDLAVCDTAYPPREAAFTLGNYSGASLMLHITQASQALEAMFGGDVCDLLGLFKRLFWEKPYFFMRANSKIGHIFAEIYDETLRENMAYLKLKTAELLLFLDWQKEEVEAFARPYYTQSQVKRIKAIEKRLTGNLKNPPSIQELAQEFQISQTTLKKYFCDVYGQPPHAHLKKRRMEEAAFLLRTSRLSIGEIAAEVGYQNASKFSASFAQKYGLSPRLYRKGVLLD